MKNTSLLGSRICPKCGIEYTAVPATSREDGMTPICPDCGAREALASLGVSQGEQQRILDIIHAAQK